MVALICGLVEIGSRSAVEDASQGARVKELAMVMLSRRRKIEYAARGIEGFSLVVVEGWIEAVGIVGVGGGGFIVFGVVAIAPIVEGGLLVFI